MAIASREVGIVGSMRGRGSSTGYLALALALTSSLALSRFGSDPRSTRTSLDGSIRLLLQLL